MLAKFCDFCGVDIEKIFGDLLENELKELYSFTQCGYGPHVEATVKIYMSNSYPELGGSKTIEIDTCHNCFKTLILDKAKQFSTEESDW